MDIEGHYAAALEFTHKMLNAAAVQDWDSLVAIEKQRAKIIEEVKQASAATSETKKARIAKMIAEMQQESAEIIERVQCWQDDVRILLRMKSPSS